MSNDFSVSVTNVGGANAGVPTGEWICRQDKFCSYAPASLVTEESSFSLSQVADYNAFAELVADRSFRTRVLIEDGSAKYGEPVCPVSTCETIVFFDHYMQNRAAVCPIGTEMELKLSGLVGDFDRCITLPNDVLLSGEVPLECTLSAGSYCCTAGSSTTIRFAHQTAPCQPDNNVTCSVPLTGYAFGACIVTDPGTCVRNLEASEVQLATSTPITPTPTPVNSTSAPFVSTPGPLTPTSAPVAPSSAPTATAGTASALLVLAMCLLMAWWH